MTAYDDKTTPDNGTGQDFYTETVVEYTDNRKWRIGLAITLVILFLLLLGITATVVVLTRGSGAPKKTETPKGVTWVRSIYGWGRGVTNSLAAPSDVAVGPDGTIWTITAGQAIVGFNPDGSLKKFIQPPRGKAEGQVHTLEGIAVARDGKKIYVTDEGKNKVIEFSPDGKWLGEWGVEYPIEITQAKDGKIALTSKSGVALVTPEPKLITKWGQRGKGNDQFDLPHGVAVGEDGTVYVADTQNQRVRAFTPKGEVKWTTGVPTSGLRSHSATDVPRSPFELPSGLTLDGQGRVVVVDAFRFHIFILDPKTGKILRKVGDYGEKDGWLAYPTGIDYDASRDWFVVADTANNRLQILRISDSGGSAVSGVRRAMARPLWVFCIPLILLLAAVVVLAMRRRAERERESSGEGDSTTP